LTSFTTSSTQSTTVTRVDLPTVQNYSTRVVGLSSDQFGTAVVFDQTVLHAPTSQEVSNLFNQARDAIRSHNPGATISNPTLVDSNQTSQTRLVSEQQNVVTTITTVETRGPATIMIGPNLSQSFFVVAGTLNKNTNTDTHTFITQNFQTTVMNANRYEILGTP
jgi:hypothetical protein